MSAWNAGASSRALRPPLDFPMIGYIRRGQASRGTHDPLCARALYLSGEGDSLVLISCDLLGLSGDFCGRLSERIAQKLGIRPECVVICCTHTHSGPDVLARGEQTAAYAQWIKRLEADIEACALEAARNRAPARLTWHLGSASIQQNRVLACNWGGKHSESWEARNWDERSPEALSRFNRALEAARADDMLDRSLPVLRVSPEARPEAVTALVVNCACHPVTLEYVNALYSADFPGVMARVLEQKWPGAVPIFLNGCCGDVNPLDRGDFEATERVGRALAQSVEAALEREGRAVAGRLRVASRRLRLKYEADYDRAELDRRLLIYRTGYETAVREGLEMEQKIYSAYRTWAEAMLRQLRDGGLRLAIDADIRLARLGGCSLVTLPFEVFGGVGKAVREALGRDTMVCAYANGDYGYLISEALYDAAKYERFESYKFIGVPGPVARDAQALVAQAVAGLAREGDET